MLNIKCRFGLNDKYQRMIGNRTKGISTPTAFQILSASPESTAD